MNDLLALIDSLRNGTDIPNGKSRLQHLAIISCEHQVHIKHVPFHQPCFILVLSGRKVIFDLPNPIVAEAGCALTVPAPASYDLRNEPAAARRRYQALIIPFTHQHLERLRGTHAIDHNPQHDHIGILKFNHDKTLIAAVTHYLQCPLESRLLDHRLMEILLVLAERDPRVLSYVLNQESWSQKVRVILSTDLAHHWELSDVCRRLATSQSTLRRQLQREATGFRDLLYDLRLSTALVHLLQTTTPVYQVAYDCGYQSVSRFSSNFRKRFGLAPTEFRAALDGREQSLAVSGQPETS
ncbi:MAG: helix-turn-helix transcriptional regulator [Gammaproteobacteria bacterium]|nr:helix-turn-helix transcriptional regulator [Gammaproteobacteria bacterium]